MVSELTGLYESCALSNRRRQKTMKKTGLAILAFGLLSLMAIYLGPSIQKIAKPVRPKKLLKEQRSFPIFDAETKWSELNQKELFEITENFSEEPDFLNQLPARETFRKDFSEMVAFGKSIIVSGTEKEEGVFTFTSITPEKSTEIPDAIALSIRNFEIDISGGQTDLAMPRIVTHSGKEVTFKSIVNQPVKGGFQGIGTSISVKPDLVPGGAILTGSIIDTGL